MERCHAILVLYVAPHIVLLQAEIYNDSHRLLNMVSERLRTGIWYMAKLYTENLISMMVCVEENLTYRVSDKASWLICAHF